MGGQRQHLMSSAGLDSFLHPVALGVEPTVPAPALNYFAVHVHETALSGREHKEESGDLAEEDNLTLAPGVALPHDALDLGQIVKGGVSQSSMKRNELPATAAIEFDDGLFGSVTIRTYPVGTANSCSL